MKNLRNTIALGLLLAASLPLSAQYDVLIRNGRVMDGSGNPGVMADVGITGDRIVFVGRVSARASAKRTIDAKGLIVAPGFIDMLGQSELNLLIDPRAVSKVTQGVTTEITGEGESVAPLNDKLKADAKDFTEHFKLKLDWISVDGYLQRLEKQKSGVNLGTYVGATQLREAVIGHEDRPPTKDEMEEMTELADDAMTEGAFGLSTALIYPPAFFAKTEELIELAKVASKHGGIYATHMRNEGDHEMEALDEVFRIAREANIGVEIFHLKVAGSQNWGNMPRVLARIEQARAEGLDITADQYPYIASATSLGSCIPPKFHEGGSDAFIARLKDPEMRKAIRESMEATSAQNFENMWRGARGPEGVLVTSVLDTSLREYEGKTIAQIAKWKQKDPVDALFDLLIADNGNTGAIYFSMKEDDLRLAMQQPWVSVGTDYSAAALEGPLSESRTHPRAWGSFPRILGKYVREDHVLTLEQAVRKMTSLPAQSVHLQRRGWIRPEYFADITIFDPNQVLDRATFENPNQVSKGIQYVLVNGVVELDGGKLTSDLGGRPLRGPGYSGLDVSELGLRPKGSLKGFITDADGWPLSRTHLSLTDSAGKEIASVDNGGREARFELVYEKACAGCTLTASRLGFKSASRKLDFNGSNPLFFTFVLQRETSVERKARLAASHKAGK